MTDVIELELVEQGDVDLEVGNIPIDQTYNPESENAQSGKAVAEALKTVEINEGVYELIETIETTEEINIDRTKEPDETAYNFKAMFVRINSTANSATDTNINIYTRLPSGGVEMVGSCYIANFTNNTATRRCYAEIYPHFGYWAGKFARWNTSQYEGTPQQGPYLALNSHNIKDYPYLARVIINKCPANSTVEIWGVRA